MSWIDNPTSLYLIEAKGGLVKIGCAEVPSKRLAVVRTHSPLPTRLIAQWRGMRCHEMRLLRALARLTVNEIKRATRWIRGRR